LSVEIEDVGSELQYIPGFLTSVTSLFVGAAQKECINIVIASNFIAIESVAKETVRTKTC
jgi:hypothetical protein